MNTAGPSLENLLAKTRELATQIPPGPMKEQLLDFMRRLQTVIKNGSRPEDFHLLFPVFQPPIKVLDPEAKPTMEADRAKAMTDDFLAKVMGKK